MNLVLEGFARKSQHTKTLRMNEHSQKPNQKYYTNPFWDNPEMGLLRLPNIFCRQHSMKSIHSAPYIHLLKLLVERRNEAGLSQSQVAEKLGRPQSYVSKFERGERRLDVIEFLEVCRHLDTDAYALLRSVELVLTTRLE